MQSEICSNNSSLAWLNVENINNTSHNSQVHYVPGRVGKTGSEFLAGRLDGSNAAWWYLENKLPPAAWAIQVTIPRYLTQTRKIGNVQSAFLSQQTNKDTVERRPLCVQSILAG